MNVGDYVRTDRGYIIKISDFKEHYTKGKRLGLKEEVVENFLLLDDKQCEIIESIDYSIPPCYPSDEELEKIKSHIIKSSTRIIDLIGVGDFVNLDQINGGIVINKSDDEIDTWSILPNKLKNEDIKSVITREQLIDMEYKVKE